MRILTYPEVLQLGYKHWAAPNPGEYGKHIWVFSSYESSRTLDEWPNGNSRFDSSDWKGRCKSLQSRGFWCPLNSQESYRDYAGLQASLDQFLIAGDDKIIPAEERIPGWIYFLTKRDPDREGDRDRVWYQDEPNKPGVVSTTLGVREIRKYRTKRRNLFEGWLESPPGFVWETARAIERELGAENPMVMTFRELVYTRDESARSRWHERVKAHEAEMLEAGGLPLPSPPLVGPDDNWRFCANPAWVQTFIMARLIGGPWWTYVLGALDALHGQIMDWSVLR